MAQDEKRTSSGANRPDLEALLCAFELGDPRTMLGFYAEDAQVRIVNGDAPQSLPFVLRGKAEISRYLHAVSDQGMTCHLESGVFPSEGRITFTQRCHYPDGTRVVVETTLELGSGGEIFRHVDVVSQEAKEEVGEKGGGRGERREEVE